MSWRHSLAVGLLPLKRPTTKAVLLTLAHHANEYTGECWPGLERIMKFTALSKRAVRDAINEAERLGYIITVRGGGRTPTHYWLSIPGTEIIDQTSATRRAPPSTEGGTSCPADQEQGKQRPPERQQLPHCEATAAPEQSMNNQENNNNTEHSARPQDGSEDARKLPDLLSADWWPSEAMMARLVAEFPTVDVTTETLQFRDKNLAKGTDIADTTAALRAWLRTAIRLEARAKRTGRPTQGPSVADSINALRARGAQLDHEDAEGPAGLRPGNGSSIY